MYSIIVHPDTPSSESPLPELANADLIGLVEQIYHQHGEPEAFFAAAHNFAADYFGQHPEQYRSFQAFVRTQQHDAPKDVRLFLEAIVR